MISTDFTEKGAAISRLRHTEKEPIHLTDKPNSYQLRFFKAVAQKIVFEHLRNFHQLLKINTFACEQLVYIRFFATNLLGKPIDRAALQS